MYDGGNERFGRVTGCALRFDAGPERVTRSAGAGVSAISNRRRQNQIRSRVRLGDRPGRKCRSIEKGAGPGYQSNRHGSPNHHRHRPATLEIRGRSPHRLRLAAWASGNWKEQGRLDHLGRGGDALVPENIQRL